MVPVCLARVFIVSLTKSERATDTEAVIVMLTHLCQEYFAQIRVRLTYGLKGETDEVAIIEA
jgi:hypothetical protein